MLKDPYGKKPAVITQEKLNEVLRDHARYVTGTGGLRAQLSHTNLDGLNLANRNLEEADLSGASLVGASLYGSNLHRASLYCADLRQTDLRMAKLVRADMRGALFGGAKLSFAVLDHADMRSGMMMYAGAGGDLVSQDTRTGNGNPDQPHGVDFSRCSMKGASFGNAKLDGVNFTGALLQGATFKNAKLTNVEFKDAVLTGVNLKDLDVPPEALKGCVLDAVEPPPEKLGALKLKLVAYELWVTTEGQRGTLGSLDGEDLRCIDNLFTGRCLSGLSMRHVTGIGIDFSGTQLQAAKFEGSDLRGANFTNVDLRGTSFKGANLLHATFNSADLRPLRLPNGTSLLPDFSGADVTEEQLQKAIRE